MKRSELFFSFLLVPIDFISIILAAVSAYFIRYADFVQNFRPVVFDLNFTEYIKIVTIIGILWIIIFAMSGLYAIGPRKFVKEFYRIVQACSTGFVLIVVLIFIRRELFDSRFIVLVAYFISIFYLAFSRGIIRLIQRALYKHGIGVYKVVIVGSSKTTDNLIQNFSTNKNAGIEIVKRFRDFSLDSENELKSFIEKKEIDEIIQADPNLGKAEMLRLYDFADEYHVVFKYAADLLGAKVLKTEVAEVAGVPIVEVVTTSLVGWGRIVKRIFDILMSVIILLFISPVLIIAALIIKLDSHGPIFFSKKDDGSPVHRVGQGGKLFKYFKFRSMVPNTDNMRYKELADKNIRNDGPMVKIKDDPRVTRIGRVIRRWSIDELPEFFLVLKGDMSIVGPRPHLPEEVARYERHHKKVLSVKPGITGLAQISGRSDLSFEEEVRLDTYYIENWSVLLDLSIILKTPLAVFRMRKAE